MQQYTFTIPDNLQAKELLNFILRTKIFYIKSSLEINDRKNRQSKMLEEDLTEAFYEIQQMEEGKKRKKTLEQFLNEF